jgi:hypothetical protein
MPIDGAVRAMSKGDLAKAFFCTGRLRSGCRLSAKVTVNGLPFCVRCGRRESKTIAGINASRADLDAQIAALQTPAGGATTTGAAWAW